MPLAAAIAGGLIAALFFLSVLTGSPGSLILVYLVQLPLYGVGLSLGVKATMIAGGTAALAASAADGVWSGAIFCLLEVLPVAVLVAQALRRHRDGDAASWSSAGALAITLVLLGAAALVVGAVRIAATGNGVAATVHGIIQDQVISTLHGGDATLPGAPGFTTGDVADLLTPLFPALAVASWLLMTMLNGVLAQGALARFQLNRRPSPDIATLALPRWFAAPLAAAAVLAFLAEGDVAYIATNLLPILAIAYVLAGLGLLHAALRRYAGRVFLLVPAYLSLIFGWPILLLAACGIIDQWFGLRSRLAGPAPR
jgi:hypothetical protein